MNDLFNIEDWLEEDNKRVKMFYEDPLFNKIINQFSRKTPTREDLLDCIFDLCEKQKYLQDQLLVYMEKSTKVDLVEKYFKKA